MKTKPDDPITGFYFEGKTRIALSPGLTKREDFTKSAMIAMLSSLNPENSDWCPNGATFDYIAKHSVSMADRVIEELNKVIP